MIEYLYLAVVEALQGLKTGDKLAIPGGVHFHLGERNEPEKFTARQAPFVLFEVMGEEYQERGVGKDAGQLGKVTFRLWVVPYTKAPLRSGAADVEAGVVARLALRTRVWQAVQYLSGGVRKNESSRDDDWQVHVSACTRTGGGIDHAVGPVAYDWVDFVATGVQDCGTQPEQIVLTASVVSKELLEPSEQANG
jgi:hypothetical protein